MTSSTDGGAHAVPTASTPQRAPVLSAPLGVRPEPFAAYTTPEFWDDPHISGQMLAAHLAPGVDAASRNHAFIDRAASWLVAEHGLGEDARVLDLGCGPGLYATRLARAGADVVGLDISRRSIEHATGVAQAEGLSDRARFAVANYLADDLGGPFDLALLAFEDLNVLSPEQRRTLLGKIAAALAPGGVLVADVTSAARFAGEGDGIRSAGAGEGTRSGENLDGGFWAEPPYHGVNETWVYPELRLVLERFVITQGDTTREFWNWMQCLTPAEVTAELAAAGFGAPTLFGDLTGAPYAEDSPTFAFAATTAPAPGATR